MCWIVWILWQIKNYTFTLFSIEYVQTTTLMRSFTAKRIHKHAEKIINWHCAFSNWPGILIDNRNLSILWVTFENDKNPAWLVGYLKKDAWLYRLECKSNDALGMVLMAFDRYYEFSSRNYMKHLANIWISSLITIAQL